MIAQLKKCSYLLTLVLVIACSDKREEQLLDNAQREQMLKVSGDFFMHKDIFNSPDIQGYSAQLERILVNKPNEISEKSLEPSCFFKHLTEDAQTNQHPAQLDAVKRQVAIFYTMQIALTGSISFCEFDNRANSRANSRAIVSFPSLLKVKNSLETLSSQYTVFHQGRIDIYEANNQLGLFALQRTKNKARAFVALNLSYEIHELPLPMGFMNSTKVTIWRSDAPETRTFVTNGKLSISPLSSVIVIVGS